MIVLRNFANRQIISKLADTAITEFLVNGKHFPQVPFDIGESYSGLLSNTPNGNSSLFFWFFPSTNPDAKKEVPIKSSLLNAEEKARVANN